MKMEIREEGGDYRLVFQAENGPFDREFLRLLETTCKTGPGVLLAFMQAMQTQDPDYWREVGRSVKELRKFIGFGPREFVELLNDGSPAGVAEYVAFEQGRGVPTRQLLANILVQFAKKLAEEKPERDEKGVYYSLWRLVNESTARRFKS